MATNQRPNMRFVPVKNEEMQGAAAVFLIRQRTQTINAHRAVSTPSAGRAVSTPSAGRWHPTEFAEVVPQGAWSHAKAALGGGKVSLRTLGATTKMGERSLRRLLVIGAGSVVIERGTTPMAQPETWLGGLLKREPGMLVRVALANSDPVASARIV